MDPEDEDFFEYATAVSDKGVPIPDGEADVYAELGGSEILPITDMNGLPLSKLVSTGFQYPRFKVPSGQTLVWAKSGEYWTPLRSVFGSRGKDGVGIESIDVDPVTGVLTITLTNGDVLNLGSIVGPPGSGVDTDGSTAGQVLKTYGDGLLTYWADEAREVELRKGTTSIEWRYVGDAAWTPLVALTDLKGADGAPGVGTPGAPGAAVQMRVNGTWLQWKLTTSADWTNLYDLSTLGGGGGGANNFRYLVGGVWQARGTATTPIWYDSGITVDPPWPSDILPGDHTVGATPPVPPS